MDTKKIIEMLIKDEENDRNEEKGERKSTDRKHLDKS